MEVSDSLLRVDDIRITLAGNMPIKLLLMRSLRLLIFVLTLLIVIIVIRLTPFPDLDAPEETCDRSCHELELPRICRFQFVLESHHLPSRMCQMQGHCNKAELDYDSKNEVLTVNRRIPGPDIRVCLHDILLIDVVNRIPYREVALHWRGITQNKSPIMDGVSMISQCPVNSYTTFQYKFRASEPGTHMWHLHNRKHDTLPANYLQGLLIVRQSIHQGVHQGLIDVDDSSHSILLRSILGHDGAAILVNGKQSVFKMKSPASIFNVTHGRAFRFRVVHSGGQANCAITGTVEAHSILVVELDGNPIVPLNITHFTIAAGERLDFVLRADQNGERKYGMMFAFSECAWKGASLIEISYVNEKLAKKFPTSNKKVEFPPSLPFTTIFTERCKKVVTCLEDLVSLSDVPNILLEETSSQVYYLRYGYKKMQLSYLGLTESVEVGHINNITFMYSSSPLASQLGDIQPVELCTTDNRPHRCLGADICYCTHIIDDVSLGSVVEVVLIHEEDNPTRDHIFHLHGHEFAVMGRQNAENKIIVGSKRKITTKEKPVLKDTLVVPQNGSAVIRFVANNVGYWLLEEEGSQGIELVFNIKGQTFDVPHNFPKCGNWIGPKYFLV